MAPTRQLRPLALPSAKTTVQNAEIYEKNATESPFLRLPPEVRNRIYRHALGGQTLHITRQIRPQRSSYTVCQHPDEDSKAAQDIREQHLEDVHYSYTEDHLDHCCVLYSHGTVKEGLDSYSKYQLATGLLRACRQIHQEAALLLYETNTFSFTGLDEILTFVQGLEQAQIKSIKKLTFAVNHRDAAFSDPRKLAALSALRSLNEITFYGASETQPATFHYVYWPWEYLIKKVEKLHIQKARVCITRPPPSARPLHSVADLARAWSEGVEKKIEGR